MFKSKIVNITNNLVNTENTTVKQCWLMTVPAYIRRSDTNFSYENKHSIPTTVFLNASRCFFRNKLVAMHMYGTNINQIIRVPLNIVLDLCTQNR